MATSLMALSGPIARVPGHLASNMGGEKVLMSVKNGKYYNLGTVGGRIWDLLESPATVQQLVDALVAEYDVTPDQCAAQIEPFLELLLKEELIRPGEAAAG